MESTIASFVYRPLSQPGNIRLVVLDPLSGTDVISCQLIEAPIGPTPTYEALSYEWGSPSASDPLITLNNKTHRVRKNLYDALFHLRLTSSKRWLWIDALSIDQTNITERNFQVSLMGEIYSGARDVLIWLGLPQEGFELAIEYLRGNNQKKFRSSQRLSLKAGDVGPQKAHGKELDAVASLCDASYWKRMWIVQEVQLAHYIVIHCGESSISWDAFSKAMKIIIESETVRYMSAVDEIRSSLPVRLVSHKRRGHRPLRFWMEDYHESRCEDSRDKVYALLGVANDVQGVLSADYSKPLPAVYRDVIQAHVHHGIGIYDLVGLRERLQQWLPQSTEDTSLALEDTEPIWLRGIDIGTISELDKFPFDAIASPDKPVPKPFSAIPSPYPAHSLQVSTQSSFRLISHRDSLLNEAILTTSEPLPPRSSKLSRAATAPDPSPTQRLRDFACSTGSMRVTGTAPAETRMGDTVIKFAHTSGTRCAVVLRRQDDHWLLIGRAKMFQPSLVGSEEACRSWMMSRAAKHESCGEEVEALQQGSSVYLQLNYATLQRLTAV